MLGRVLLLAIIAASYGCPPRGPDVHLPSEPAVSSGFFGPDDFAGTTATIRIPRDGATIVIVPALSVDDNEGELRATVTAVDAATRVTPLHPLPPPTKRVPAELPSPLDAGSAPPATRRTFAIYDQSTQQYVAAAGTLAFTSAGYAFYEDPANPEQFSAEDYRALAGVADRGLHVLEQIFGSPTDLDGTDKIAVYISKTDASRHPNGQAHVDACNHSDADCMSQTPRGEIIYFWDPDSVRSIHGGTLRDLAVDYFARNILHETIHLCQASHRIRRGGLATESWSLPDYVVEGQAELARFVLALDLANKYDEISHSLRARRGLAQDAYQAGSLFFVWLHRYFGPGVQQALLDGFVANDADDAVDPFASATRAPEPLLIGMLFAAVYGQLDGVLADERARLKLAAPPALDGRFEARASYTQPAIVSVPSPGLVRIELESKVRAWVIVVPTLQPRNPVKPHTARGRTGRSAGLVPF